MELTDKTSIAVTGASRGIGRSIALALAEKGVRLALLSRSRDELHAVAQEVSRRGAPAPHVHVGSVADAADVAAFLAEIKSKSGRLDALINNAGIGIMKPVDELSDDDFLDSLHTNLVGPFRLMRGALKLMKAQGSGGHIINISSVAGEVGFPKGGAYCASKFGLEGLSECLMQEVRREGIKVSVVEPGSVNTRFGSGEDTDWKLSPDEVARSVVHLLESADNALINKLQLRPTLQGKPE